MSDDQHAYVEYLEDKRVAVLHWENNDNRFNPGSIAMVMGKLDEIEAKGDSVGAVVFTGAGKFFSNGFDQVWMAENPSLIPQMLASWQVMAARILTFCLPTVAAINGHAFAAGMMYALASDVRIMRSDRGFLCMPEINLQLHMSAGMCSLLSVKLGGDPRFLRDCVFYGKRFGAQTAVERMVVDEAVPEKEVLPRAIEVAAQLANQNYAPSIMHSLKYEVYRTTFELLKASASDINDDADSPHSRL